VPSASALRGAHAVAMRWYPPTRREPDPALTDGNNVRTRTVARTPSYSSSPLLPRPMADLVGFRVELEALGLVRRAGSGLEDDKRAARQRAPVLVRRVVLLMPCQLSGLARFRLY